MKIKLIKYDHSRVQNTEKTNAICVFCKYFSKIDNSRKSSLYNAENQLARRSSWWSEKILKIDKRLFLSST